MRIGIDYIYVDEKKEGIELYIKMLESIFDKWLLSI